MIRYGGCGDLALCVAFWTIIAVVGLAVCSAVFLATREVMATIEAPRCVLDPSSQVWRGPPL